nr:hypothetical protein [Nannocystis pusilla]
MRPLRLDVRQTELFPHDLSELFEGDLHLERLATLLLAGLARAALAVLTAAADRVAGLAVALADALAAVVAVDEPRDVDLRHRDGDRALALGGDHVAARDVFAQVLPDLPRMISRKRLWSCSMREIMDNQSMRGARQMRGGSQRSRARRRQCEFLRGARRRACGRVASAVAASATLVYHDR